MPTLDELKAKWFIPMTGNVLGVRTRRHTEGGPGPHLSVSTDGNIVVLLIDGEAYMREWHRCVAALAELPGAEIYQANWRLEAVYPLGHNVGPDALSHLAAAKNAGTAVYPLLSSHVGTFTTNEASNEWLRERGVSDACRDQRFPPNVGSNHQKVVIFKSSGDATAILGSIDISKTRWDTTEHRAEQGLRNPDGAPTHDTGVSITGPAVRDIELDFRERWNDSTRITGMTPVRDRPLITTPLAVSPGGGSHSVQVLRTYGLTQPDLGYSWSARGEFTVWAAFLNALRNATRYIYIEDQYFLPWDYPPRFARPAGAGRDVDIVYQLGEAMKRGVNVVIVTPARSEDIIRIWQNFQRSVGINYLLGVRRGGSPGDVVVASLRNDTDDVMVHSKLMIVDDELVLIGTANVCQRSMTHDGEIHVAIVDSAETFARETRKAIWAEHTGRPTADLNDDVAAFFLFKADTDASRGRLKPCPVDRLSVYPPVDGTSVPVKHQRAIRDGIDPFAGPPPLR